MNENEALESLALLHHVEKITDKRIHEAIERHELENSQVLATISVRLDDISKQIVELRDFIRAGFPHGDPVSHRAVHENYIKQAQERSAAWSRVKTNILQGAIWAVLTFVSVAIWTAIKEEVKR